MNFYRHTMTIGGDFALATAVPVTWIPKARGEKRRRRKECKPTSEAQAWCNRIHAEQKLFYIAHQNFGLDDYRLGLDFAGEYLPRDIAALKKTMRLYLLRLKRVYKRHGRELKYIWVPERSGRGRYHVHGFLSGGVPREEIEKAWGKGRANCERLQYDRQGLAGYTHYICKDPLLGKRWCGSRNLKTPTRRQSDYKLRRKDVDAVRRCDREALERIYPGWAVVETEVRDNDVNGMPYLYIRLCRKGAAFSY